MASALTPMVLTGATAPYTETQGTFVDLINPTKTVVGSEANLIRAGMFVLVGFLIGRT